MPTPYWPTAGSVRPCRPQARRRNASGSWIRMPGAVALQRIGARRAAMGEVLEDRSPCVTIAWVLLALDVGDESEAAGVVLVGGVVQTLTDRGPMRCIPRSFFHD